MPSARSISSHAAREDALAVLLRLRQAGHVAYFAGGCVRDLLLGADPKDFDVATDAPPGRVRELFPRTQAVGAAFGVILVHQGSSRVEVATFRTEADYSDGRHPSQVRFTTAEEDARRRDFTVNGLFLDPVSGDVIDYVGGKEDLRDRTLRAIGSPAERFDEDSLRLLRAVRFSARLGFAIEPVTAAAIRSHAPQLRRVSPERIAEELRIMLVPPTRVRAWRLLWELDLIDTIFRFLKFDRTEPDPRRPFLFDRLAPGESVPFGLALAAGALCYRMRTERDGAGPRELLTERPVSAAVRALRQSLRISNEESDHLSEVPLGVGPLLRDEPPTVAMLKRFLAAPAAASGRKLLDALATAGHSVERIDRLRKSLFELEREECSPLPLIDGNMLQDAGLTPGPTFKRILNEVYDAQLEGRVLDRDQAMAMAMRLAGR